MIMTMLENAFNEKPILSIQVVCTHQGSTSGCDPLATLYAPVLDGHGLDATITNEVGALHHHHHHIIISIIIVIIIIVNLSSSLLTSDYEYSSTPRRWLSPSTSSTHAAASRPGERTLMGACVGV